jgi:hypothetical protein
MTDETIIPKVKLFCLANSLVENKLDKLETELGLDLGRVDKTETKRKISICNLKQNFEMKPK